MKRSKRNADDSVDLVLETLTVVSSEAFGEIDSHRGDVSMVVLTDSAVGNEMPGINVDEILKSQPDAMVYDNQKSYSQRLRNMLYALHTEKLGKEPTKEQFADFYKQQYELILNHYRKQFKN